MSKYMSRITPLALTFALGVAACSKGDNKADTSLAQDTASPWPTCCARPRRRTPR